MYYVYILQSLKDKKFYTGFTNDVARRLQEHNNGAEFSTAHRAPFQLIYYEACVSKTDAITREKYLKSGKGKIFIKTRLKKYLESLCVNLYSECAI